MIRRQFFIKPKLQIKYMAITAAIVIISAVVVYILLHQVLRSSGGMEQLTTGEWGALQRALNRSLIMIIGFIAIVLAIESVFFFHRMVGPLYVFEKVLNSVKEGDLTQRVNLRQGDEFKEVAAEYNGMAESLVAKISALREASDKISAVSVNLSPETKEAAARLSSALDAFKTK
ncbi:MAG: methyl-accepting chemotaxis protein [Endomicrobiia bacterium]|nr:methyl-accepting chemotaxis protein [Endomicrobiia bacterium]